MKNNPFEIIHLGGEKTVTGSCHLLRANNLNVMVDCGLAQGGDKISPISDWPVSPKEIDYLFLTHSHLDHIGRLPELIGNGFHGEIICTHPTKALLEPMLHDGMSLAGLKRNEIKKINLQIDDLSWGFEYDQEFKLKKGLTFHLGRAGHILGSCFIRFEITHGTEPQIVVFSGDLGNIDSPILTDPDRPPSCDLLIMESTYGNRLHPNRTDRQQKLASILERALCDGGKVFIPAFSLGRTQEILYELDRLFADENWRKALSPPANAYDRGRTAQSVPVFIDSPLGLKITDIYSSLSSFWDKEARELLLQNDNPIDFDRLYSVNRYRDHQQLLDIPGPAIIIAGSGMCSGGRIVDHLSAGLADGKNDIIFVGYQAHGTLGQSIKKYGKRRNGYVYIDGRKVSIKAKIYSLSGYSAHADQQGLMNWVASMPQKPGRIKLVHGDEGAQQALAAKLIAAGYILSTK